MSFKLSSWKLYLGVLALVWPIFAPGLDNTQRILSTIFSYVGVRLLVYVLYQSKKET